MGILPKHLHLLAITYPSHPIRGDVLVLGQQFIYASLKDVRDIFEVHGMIANDLPSGFDTMPRIPNAPKDFTNVQSVLTLLGAKSVRVADVSDYENPDYIIDLNYNVDPKYVEKFDVVLDVGTLEHVFDVPTALNNIVRMLKPSGNVVLCYPASNAIDHGFYSFSPTLLYDYFAVNGFSNFSCYLLEGTAHNLYKKEKIYIYNGFDRQFPLVSPHGVEVFFFATKERMETELHKPTQSIYVDTGNHANKPKSQQVMATKQDITLVRRLLRAANRLTRRWRPEIIDSILFSKLTKVNKKDNLEYIGKF